MTFHRPRVTAGAYSRQLGDLPVKSTPMCKGRGNGGPLHGVILDADSKWEGKIKADPSGHYHWDGKCWTWIMDEPTPAPPPTVAAREKVKFEIEVETPTGKKKARTTRRPRKFKKDLNDY